MTSTIGLQIAMLGEIAERNGVSRGNALRWCLSEALVERFGVDSFKVTAAGQAAISQHMRDHIQPAHDQAVVGVRRERPEIVVARTVSEARALGGR